MKQREQEQEVNRAKQQARAELERIVEMVKELEAAAKDDSSREAAEQAIHEAPLEVQVRSGWHHPHEKSAREEYEILLCTGGPAVRLIGDLTQYQEPESARLEYQDWFTSWTDYPLDREEETACVRYAQCFYFGT